MKVEITTDKIAAGYVLKLAGDVDMNTSPDVRTALAPLFGQGGLRLLVVDLAGVRYMDSSGIATLVEAMQNCLRSGARLRLADLSPSVRDVFELARLSGIFEIFPSVRDASAG